MFRSEVLPVLLFSLLGSGFAHAKDFQIGPSAFNCGPCMGDCTTVRIPKSAVVAEVSGARFRGYIVAGCPQFGDEPCHEFFSRSLYSFDKMTFHRNDFKADEKTKFEVFYSFSTMAPEKWDGIYLHGDRRYAIVATDSGLHDTTEITFACELVGSP